MNMVGLEKLDIQILLSIYKMKYEFDNEPNIHEYEEGDDGNGFAKRYYAYVENLKEKEYLMYKGNPCVRGGMPDPKYHHNILHIMWENVDLKEKGLKVLEVAKSIMKDLDNISIEEVSLLNQKLKEQMMKSIDSTIMNNVYVGNGAQFNQHQGSGDIHAVQNNSSTDEDIQAILKKVLEVVNDSTLEEEEKEDYCDLITVAEDQTTQPIPKESWIRRGIRKLEDIKQMVATGALVVNGAENFVQGVEKLIQHLASYIN